jgi:hypothetical protein
MKGIVKLEDTGEKHTKNWFSSLERRLAVIKFIGDFKNYQNFNDPDSLELENGKFFRGSKEFVDARSAFRKRVNKQWE